MGAEEYRGVAGDIGNVRGNLWENFRGKYSDLQQRMRAAQDAARGWTSNVANIRMQDRPNMQEASDQLARGSESLAAGTDALGRSIADTAAARQRYQEMMNDPSKRGYGDDTLNKMYGKQADIATASKGNLQRDLNKAAAAGGMGGTGAAMRNAMTANERLSSDLLGSRRDIDIANAEASREDLNRATSGMLDVGQAERGIQTGQSQIASGRQGISSGFQNMQSLEDAWQRGMLGLEGQGMGLEQSALGLENQGLSGENQFYAGTIMPSFEDQLKAYQLANQKGFWGNLGNSIASNLGSWFGPGGYSAIRG